MSDLVDRLRSALEGRYTVQREIGAGGMATVYLAQDLRHHRAVAIKVLRPELGGALGGERFLREIELAARLQHPHILPVFDSGELAGAGADRLLWYVMPYVEGESLRARLLREGRLSVEDAVQIAREVASALAYAHAHGVVHRDIKPENILLTGGYAVVADFGIAKALESTAGATTPGGTKLTHAGLAIGTPQYMSPEQVGDGTEVGPRSDQYGLACVLYEMLTGEPPFTGPTSQVVVARSLSAPRPRVRRVRADVPPAVEEVIVRALAIAPADRFPDMSAFAAALSRAASDRRRAHPRRRRTTWVAAAAGSVLALGGVWFAFRDPRGQVASDAQVIAVLPFTTRGAGVELMGEGMVDLLATDLEGVGGIRTVDPRTVLNGWRKASGGKPADLATALSVGRQVGAGSVVVGSVVAAGRTVRLAADLYSTKGERLGRAQVDGSADSVLPLADRLSLALVREVWRSREPPPSLRTASLITESPAALREFLRGEQYYRRTQFDSALSAYDRAVELDSTFAIAHFRRALMYGWTGGYGNEHSRSASAAGFRFAHRLPARDRSLLAAYRLFEQGKPAAVDSLRRFITAYPRDIEGWFLFGEALFHSRAFTAADPDTIRAAFDSVVRLDSSLVPALIHPMELALLYRDSAGYARYLRLYERELPRKAAADARAAAVVAWGEPSDSVLRALTSAPQGFGHVAIISTEGRADAPAAGIRMLERIPAVNPAAKLHDRDPRILRGYMLAGLGRLAEARRLADSLEGVAPDDMAGILGWPIVLGLAPPSYGGERLSSWLASQPPGLKTSYLLALRDLGQGDADAALRRIEAALADRDSAAVPSTGRGDLIAARGWAYLQKGDTAAGIRDLRRGLDEAAAPRAERNAAVPLFQLALALSSRPDTREEGIRRLRYGFDDNVLVLPLTYLALGRAYEAEGDRPAAAAAYGRFVRLWDHADPALQPRVHEARAALQRLTEE